MSKVLVEVFLPATGKTIEMKVPREIKIGQVTNMLIDYLSKQTGCGYIPMSDAVLCDYYTGNIYNTDVFVGYADWKDGHRVIFI